jgi:hypothetical protein
MNYYYNYSLLEEKLINHYKGKNLTQAIDAFGKDLHSNIYRIRDIIMNKVTCFTGNEITRAIEILGLDSKDVIKCFFNVEKGFVDKKDLLNYIKSKKQD